MSIAVIIVNYRTPEMTVDCLRSLADETSSGVSLRAVVCDNHSDDGSTEKIVAAIEANGWTSWARVIPLAQNGGFAFGNNAGLREELRHAENSSFLLLNSDTVVRPGAIAQLLEGARSRPDAGVIAPRLEYLDGTAQISCFRNPSPVTEFLAAARTGPLTRLLKRHEIPLPVSDSPIEMEWASFACVLIRREVIERVGLLDEGYFMYYEDVDYCRAIRSAGWRVVYWPEAHVVHLRGGTSPVKSLTAARKRRPRYYYESRSRYLAKFYGHLGLWTANLMWWCGRTISFARERLGNKAPHTCSGEGRDIWIRGLDPLGRRLEAAR